MRDEERKAWEEYVVWVRMADMDMMGYEGFKKDRPAILAADAELKRLREAIEWACENIPGYMNLKVEIRRRAKEGTSAP